MLICALAASRAFKSPIMCNFCLDITGDAKWISDPYRPKRGKPLEDNDSGGLSPASASLCWKRTMTSVAASAPQTNTGCTVS